LARQTKVVKIDNPSSRDHGKAYLITEMPARRAEALALRALLALGRSGAMDVPEEVSSGATAAVAAIAPVGGPVGQLGAFAAAGRFEKFMRIAPEEAQSILDELMDCVKIMPNPDRSEMARGLHGEDDVEEVSTLFQLKMEVLNLHLGFLQGGDGSSSQPSPPPAPEASISNGTPTFLDRLARQSRRS